MAKLLAPFAFSRHLAVMICFASFLELCSQSLCCPLRVARLRTLARELAADCLTHSVLSVICAAPFLSVLSCHKLGP
jgi:hypothetical protein